MGKGVQCWVSRVKYHPSLKRNMSRQSSKFASASGIWSILILITLSYQCKPVEEREVPKWKFVDARLPVPFLPIGKFDNKEKEIHSQSMFSLPIMIYILTNVPELQT